MVSNLTSKHAVRRICQTLSLAESSYYKHKQHKISNREKEDILLLEEIKQIHKQSRQTYGVPRIEAALRKMQIKTSRKRVRRLMKSVNIESIRHRKFIATTNSRALLKNYLLIYDSFCKFEYDIVKSI